MYFFRTLFLHSINKFAVLANFYKAIYSVYEYSSVNVLFSSVLEEKNPKTLLKNKFKYEISEISSIFRLKLVS